MHHKTSNFMIYASLLTILTVKGGVVGGGEVGGVVGGGEVGGVVGGGWGSGRWVGTSQWLCLLDY